MEPQPEQLSQPLERRLLTTAEEQVSLSTPLQIARTMHVQAMLTSGACCDTQFSSCFWERVGGASDFQPSSKIY